MRSEVLLKTSYLNVTFKGFTYGVDDPNSLTNEDLGEEFHKRKEDAENKSVEELKEELSKVFTEEQLQYLTRHEGKQCKEREVPLDALCFDDVHSTLDFHGKKVERGELLRDFFDEHKDVLELDFILKHYDFFSKNTPIIVRKLEEKYEVLEGNHRAFAAMKKDKEKITALISL